MVACCKIIYKKNTKVLLYLLHAKPMSCEVTTSRRHIIKSHDVMMPHHRPSVWYQSTQIRKPWKKWFFGPGDLDLWLMTLTIELVREVIKVNPCAKFHDHMPNGSALRVLTDKQAHTQTAPFLKPRPLTREVKIQGPCVYNYHVTSKNWTTYSMVLMFQVSASSGVMVGDNNAMHMQTAHSGKSGSTFIAPTLSYSGS